ncbi:MAG: hypothetical protein M1834_007398 [Cirrosporium novae-zelandiae]|nr:MAG: hypothetical protein M1834_007398 [Cirrosporium novae-zelandiae]
MRACNNIQSPLRRIIASRFQSTATAPLQEQEDGGWTSTPSTPDELLQSLPSPPLENALKSAKLAALHARLSLSSRLPLQTLALTLVDPSADPSPQFNNSSFSVLGNDLLGYYTSEHLLCQYPRLPMPVLFAAIWAYIGPPALASITREWGVEIAYTPGGEVDSGLLQFRRLPPDVQLPAAPAQTTRPNDEKEAQSKWRRGMSSRTVYDDIFGDLKTHPRNADSSPDASSPSAALAGISVEHASMNFVRALMGAIYLHVGRPAAKAFFAEHFLSRTLSMHKLFDFGQPTRDLSRLCAREGFESPIARIESETGRNSRHPVFVVGVYSGKDKIGEGHGSSLDEARFRAATAALKSWYLYSPLEVRVPSEMEDKGSKAWNPVLVDVGEVVS